MSVLLQGPTKWGTNEVRVQIQTLEQNLHSAIKFRAWMIWANDKWSQSYMVPACSCDFLEDSSLFRYQKVLFNLINGKQMGTMMILQEFIAPQNWHSQHLPTRRGCGRDEFAQRDLRQGKGGPVGRNGQVLLIIGIFIDLYWIWCNSPKEPWPGPKKNVTRWSPKCW